MLCDGGVLLVSNVNRLRHDVRNALQIEGGAVFSWVLNADQCAPDVTAALAEWRELVNWQTLPAGIVVPACQLAGMREISAQLALAGGVLGVFTELGPALTWARRQALVFAAEAGLRIRATVGT